MEQCIKLHGKRDGTRLLDPFMGIGSSALAARSMGIASCIGFEIDEQYLEIARERLAGDDAGSRMKAPAASQVEPELPL